MNILALISIKLNWQHCVNFEFKKWILTQPLCSNRGKIEAFFTGDSLKTTLKGASWLFTQYWKMLDSCWQLFLHYPFLQKNCIKFVKKFIYRHNLYLSMNSSNSVWDLVSILDLQMLDLLYKFQLILSCNFSCAIDHLKSVVFQAGRVVMTAGISACGPPWVCTRQRATAYHSFMGRLVTESSNNGKGDIF